MADKTNVNVWVATFVVGIAMILPLRSVWAGPTTAQEVSVQNCSRVEKAGEWLRSRQNDETGLLRSYDMPGDCKAWTYDEAVGILALLAVGDTNTATKCADGMLAIRRDLSHDPNHVWVDAYNSVDGKEDDFAKAVAVGPNAWMGLALLKLYLATGKNEYLSAAEAVGEFILKLQAREGCAAGSISGGYDGDGNLFTWTSTEHNADAIGFLVGLAEATDVNDYRIAGVNVANWLDREMWDPDPGRYHLGYKNNDDCNISDFPEWLDSQTWTLLALQALAGCDGNDPNIARLIHSGLPWIDQYALQVNNNDCNLAGFAKVTSGLRATDSFWAEGTAGYVLAAGAACHSKTNQNVMLNSLRCLQDPNGSLPYSIGITCPNTNQLFEPCDIILAHFEAHPHCLYGDVGVHGDGEPNWDAIKDANFEEPYCWYYQPEKPGYNDVNVHTGWQSFRLVNATEMSVSQDKRWASIGMDLGPKTCGVVESRDVSDYGKFVFWAKTDNIDGANVEVVFRDANWGSYLPQVNTPPIRLGNDWTRHEVNLADVIDVNGLKLSKLAHVGLAFGQNVGNAPGTIIYIDDMGFTESDTNTPLSNGAEMPRVFPQHWPYGSVAATGWFIFAELETNPFAVACDGPLKPCLGPPGDINLDCRVDFSDLKIMVARWLETGCGYCDGADLDDDSDVKSDDFAILANNWLEGYRSLSDTCWGRAACVGQPCGDATCDGSVNFLDLGALKVSFFSSKGDPAYNCCADFDHDDAVNFLDLGILKVSFFTDGYTPSTGNQDCPP